MDQIDEDDFQIINIFWGGIQTNSNREHRGEQAKIQGQLGKTKLQGQVNWYGQEGFLSGLKQ